MSTDQLGSANLIRHMSEAKDHRYIFLRLWVMSGNFPGIIGNLEELQRIIGSSPLISMSHYCVMNCENKVNEYY